MPYMPPNCSTLDSTIYKKRPQIRLGIQGFFGEGKTHAALTFPNPIVANFDRGLGAHYGRKDIIDVPFYSDVFVNNIVKPTIVAGLPIPNRRDALRKWLLTEGVKLEHDQTLVIDAGTGVEAAFHRQEAMEPILTKSGEVDTFAAWRHKIDYFDEITDILISLNCDVVWIAHEQDERDKKGAYTGKIRPLMTGQFADKLGSKFTDWFRQLAKDKKEPDDASLKNWGMTRAQYSAMCNTYPRNTIYFWQTDSDDIVSCKASSIVNFPKFIPATYEAFSQYFRKQTT